MNKFLVVFFLFTLTLCRAGDELIISERPGQAFSPYCLSKNSFQIQTGVNFYRSAKVGATNSTTIRFGLEKYLK